jgi:hypothetical protein
MLRRFTWSSAEDYERSSTQSLLREEVWQPSTIGRIAGDGQLSRLKLKKN